MKSTYRKKVKLKVSQPIHPYIQYPSDTSLVGFGGASVWLIWGRGSLGVDLGEYCVRCSSEIVSMGEHLLQNVA